LRKVRHTPPKIPSHWRPPTRERSRANIHKQALPNPTHTCMPGGDIRQPSGPGDS